MLKICAVGYKDMADKEVYTIVLLGNADAWREFLEVLGTIKNEAIQYVLSAPPASELGERIITVKYLNLAPRDKMLDVQYANETAYIAGSQVELGNLAFFVKHLIPSAHRGHSAHIHIEHSIDSDAVTAESIPLIIQGLAEDE